MAKKPKKIDAEDSVTDGAPDADAGADDATTVDLSAAADTAPDAAAEPPAATAPDAAPAADAKPSDPAPDAAAEPPKDDALAAKAEKTQADLLAEPPPAPSTYVPKFRVKETKVVSHYGQIHKMHKGDVLDGSGYGQEGIRRLVDAGLELEEVE